MVSPGDITPIRSAFGRKIIITLVLLYLVFIMFFSILIPEIPIFNFNTLLLFKLKHWIAILFIPYIFLQVLDGNRGIGIGKRNMPVIGKTPVLFLIPTKRVPFFWAKVIVLIILFYTFWALTGILDLLPFFNLNSVILRIMLGYLLLWVTIALIQ